MYNCTLVHTRPNKGNHQPLTRCYISRLICITFKNLVDDVINNDVTLCPPILFSAGATDCTALYLSETTFFLRDCGDSIAVLWQNPLSPNFRKFIFLILTPMCILCVNIAFIRLVGPEILMVAKPPSFTMLLQIVVKKFKNFITNSTSVTNNTSIIYFHNKHTQCHLRRSNVVGQYRLNCSCRSFLIGQIRRNLIKRL